MLSIAAGSPSVGSLPPSTRRGVCASFALHVFAGAAVLLLAGGDRANLALAIAPDSAPATTTHIVYVARELPSGGPSGGGGGGGNRQTGPIRRAESHGSDAMTLRVAKPVAMIGGFDDRGPALPGLLLDAKPLASGDEELVGLPTGGVSGGWSTGPGSGGGIGTGTGSGIGSGRGPGLGSGVGGGTGGGVYRIGGGVSAPRLLVEVRPKYTTSALERRIQGSVVIELIVDIDGSATQLRVVQSLDPGGLDKEAIAAVAQWKFAPGQMRGSAVAVLVSVVLDFTIR